MASDEDFSKLSYEGKRNLLRVMREHREATGEAYLPSEERPIEYGGKELFVRAGRLRFGWRKSDFNKPIFEYSKDYETTALHWGGRALWLFLNEARQDSSTSLSEAVHVLPVHIRETLDRMGGAEAFLKTRVQQMRFEDYAASPMMYVEGTLVSLCIRSVGDLHLKWDTKTNTYTEEAKDSSRSSDAVSSMGERIKKELDGMMGTVASWDLMQLIDASVLGKRGGLELPNGEYVSPLRALDRPTVVSGFMGFEAHEGKMKLAREGVLQVQPDGRASLYSLDGGTAEYAWAGSAVLDYNEFAKELRKEFGSKPYGFMREDSKQQNWVARGTPWGGMNKLVEGRSLHQLLSVLAEDGLVVTASEDLSVAKVAYPAHMDSDVAGKMLMELHFKKHGVELHTEGAETVTGAYGQRDFGRVVSEAMKIGSMAVLRPDMANVSAQAQWTAFTKLVGEIEEGVRLEGYAENSPKGKALGERLMAQGFVVGEKAEVTKEVFGSKDFTGAMPPDARAKLHFWSGEGQKMLKETVAKARSAVEKEVAPARRDESR